MKIKIVFLLLILSGNSFAQQASSIKKLLTGEWLLVKHIVADKKGEQKDIFQKDDVRTFEFFENGHYKLVYTSNIQPGFTEEGDWDIIDTNTRTKRIKLYNNGLKADDKESAPDSFYALSIKKLNDEFVTQEYIYYEKNLALLGTSYYRKKK